MKTLAVPATLSDPVFPQNMFTTGFTSNAHSECVFLCVRSSASVCESTVWAPTIGYLCLFRKAGPQRPGSTV